MCIDRGAGVRGAAARRGRVYGADRGCPDELRDARRGARGRLGAVWRAVRGPVRAHLSGRRGLSRLCGRARGGRPDRRARALDLRRLRLRRRGRDGGDAGRMVLPRGGGRVGQQDGPAVLRADGGGDRHAAGAPGGRHADRRQRPRDGRVGQGLGPRAGEHRTGGAVGRRPARRRAVVGGREAVERLDSDDAEPRLSGPEHRRGADVPQLLVAGGAAGAAELCHQHRMSAGRVRRR